LGYLGALEAGYLFEYEGSELSFWTVVAVVVKRSKLAAMRAELLGQMEERRRLMSEAIPILSKYGRYASGNYKLPHLDYAGSLQGCDALCAVFWISLNAWCES
jgi:hypothetical protein